ncbi:hypothetical protein A1Q2_08418 [Trichosporon asahii var. asahii CBS 8904]|uniref:Uncharacterized protein n=1 Tax=Trichosporon asahii var. asahii (strain CBS 8904) TaxID=1220162 RepID=K1V981_TRIAC|nr:hypothetical protein A1Q2_08418 [Trichosporon asahii var. asahii CBS 8904]
MLSSLIIALATLSVAPPALSASVERPVAIAERELPALHLFAREENGSPSPANSSAIMDLAKGRLGAQLGGTNKNSTGELDEAGWLRNCSDQCASFKALWEEKYVCDGSLKLSGDFKTKSCSGTQMLRVKDGCESELVQAGWHLYPEIEGIDMSKVSAAATASISVAAAMAALGASLFMMA